MIELGIHKLYDDVQDVAYATEQSSCFDLRAYLKDDVVYYGTDGVKQVITGCEHICVAPLERVIVPTGMILDIPKGYSVRLHARSGLAIKYGITLINGEGVIDSDYVHQLFIGIVNNSTLPFVLDHGMRVAQAEIIQEVQCKFYACPAPAQKTDRTGGMGSTGQH